eukprot:TRINITY_DN2829_c0_g1_i1.p1 TRINITY_DN2829_c0_g1~~TRINITY_DN2829_c0_g1_i1.p1  ORF type:complete len:360 (-),score=95.28 TRINITY_DN2829_c0_g1_i1:348-1358(-)
MAKVEKVTVLGGGSFGTALGFAVSKNCNKVTILVRNPEIIKSINEDHRNCSYLSDFALPVHMEATDDPAKAFEGTSFIVHSIPVQASFDFLRNLAPHIPPTVPIISSSKGLHTQTLKYMSDIIPDALGRTTNPLAFVSGPSFARELMSELPTAFVAASTDTQLAVAVQHLFSSQRVRVYTTDDVVGVEVGGALKNVFAIAAGIIEGLGLGMNTTAALLTRGTSEMTKLAVRMGARPATVAGLSGIGDLMLTCYGALSRNRTVGKRLGSGETLEAITESMSETAEGVATSPAAARLAEQYGLDLPIVRTMADIIEGRKTPQDAMNYLMSRPLRPEDE